jgi:hypothetical protein
MFIVGLGVRRILKEIGGGRHPDMEPLTSANTEGYVLTKTLKRVYGECLSVPNPLPGKSGFNP